MATFPLTTVQQAVWLDQLLTPEAPCYNVGALWHIDTAFTADLLHDAIRKVMAQHEALNIILEEDEHGINQTTVHKKEPVLEYHDVSQASLSLNEAKAFIRRQFIKPFKLHGELLWRSMTVKVNDVTTLWLFSTHHIIADGTSVSLLSKMIMAGYKSLQAQALCARSLCGL